MTFHSMLKPTSLTILFFLHLLFRVENNFKMIQLSCLFFKLLPVIIQEKELSWKTRNILPDLWIESN